AQIDSRRGGASDVQPLLEDGLRRLAADDWRGRAGLLFELAIEACRTSRRTDALVAARHALDAAKYTDDAGLQCAAAALTALAEYCVGEVPAARVHLAEAASQVDSFRDGELTDRLSAVFILAHAETRLAEHAAAL